MTRTAANPPGRQIFMAKIQAAEGTTGTLTCPMVRL